MSKTKSQVSEWHDEEGPDVEEQARRAYPAKCPHRGRSLTDIVYRLRWTLEQQKIRWRNNEF